jgi:hypothetical protein
MGRGIDLVSLCNTMLQKWEYRIIETVVLQNNSYALPAAKWLISQT